MENIMKKVWKTFLQKIFIMAVISGVLIAVSILAYRSTYPKELTLSEDGYYEIYTHMILTGSGKWFPTIRSLYAAD